MQKLRKNRQEQAKTQFFIARAQSIKLALKLNDMNDNNNNFKKTISCQILIARANDMLKYLKKRNKLIGLVITEGLSIPKISKLLNIKLSTAKNIIKIYKRQGKVMQKKMSRPVKNQKTVDNSILIQQNIKNSQQQIMQQNGNSVEISNKQSNPVQIIPIPYYSQYNWIPIYFYTNFCQTNSLQLFNKE